MPSFGTVALPDINPLFDLASVDRNVNAINGGRLANQLASNTLDSNTKIAANAAEGGALANQYASQRNPLEISLLRQQTGAEPSPVFDKLQNLYNGGGQPAGTPGDDASAAPIGDFEHAMAGRESSNDPAAVNAGGYAGMFQFGAPRLAAIGAYTPAPGEIDDKGKWNGQMGGQFHISGHPEVKTLQDFLHDPAAQTDAFKSHVAGIDAGIAQTPGADKFDPNGLRAVAHLGGIEGMQKFVSTGGTYNPADSNGTKLSDYYKRFSQGGAPALVAAFGPRQSPPAAPAQPGVALAPNAPAAPAPTPVQTATRGPMPGDTANDGTSTPTPGFGPDGQPLPAGTWNASPVAAAPQAAPTGQGASDVMARLRNAPQVQNPNSLLDVAAPDGSAPPAPQNALAPAPVPVQPAAAVPPGAPAQPAAPAAQPATGMNSPQVQQAQDLMRRATQIEIAAAATPNDPRAKAAAAAMAADLRARASVIMNTDSVVVQKDGTQLHPITGKVDSAATPAMNYQPDPNNPGVLISPGNKPVVLPPGRATTLPDGSTWVTGPGGTFKEVREANLEGASAASAAAAGGKHAAESAAKTKDALIPLARTSIQAISNIDYGLHQLDEAAKGGIPTGYFAPALATAAAAAKSIGVKIPGVDPAAVSDIQTASKTLAVVSGAILQNIIGKGEITDGKIEAFIHAQPGIVNDPQATHRILNWARSQFTYDHEMAMDGLAAVDPKSGQLAPGWQAGYITKHGAGPIFDSASGEMKQPDGQGPSREPPVEAAKSTPPPATAAPHTPSVGTVMQGHRFLGGDPSKPASWQAVQ